MMPSQRISFVLPILLLASCASTGTVARYAGGNAAVSSDAEPILQPTGSRPTGPVQGAAVSNLTLLVGSRELDDEFFWQPLDEQDFFGIEYDTYVPGELGYEFGIHFADASETLLGVPLESDTLEFNFGARKTWDVKSLHPYIGGGLSLLAASLDIGDGLIDEADAGVGFYLHGGAYYRLGESVTIGVDYRRLFGTDIELTGFVPTDVDYDQLAFTIGYSF